MDFMGGKSMRHYPNNFEADNWKNHFTLTIGVALSIHKQTSGLYVY